ncbi:c-type cytochrome [Pontibacter sp. KCTC 32443]|uniref:c-type cytochrome n=1 Tax=Pontibacter TaxID=323449 RepID=UPI00164D2452|nr:MULTISPECIES: c-type cytochrome [Pontibacter]MBC5774831.1 c-type cytochrome [Pontibacter sp. KCTC 32443]
MKKAILLLACGSLLVACENKKTEYDEYYEQGYKDSVATITPERPTNTQTRVGSDAAVNDLTDSVAAPAATTTTATASAASAEGKKTYELGASLISKSDCLTCHKDDQKVVGPAYTEVADKYEFNDKNVDYLAQKIIKGGAGVWGQIPMPPHPDLKPEDAKEMARYVLSLKK